MNASLPQLCTFCKLHPVFSRGEFCSPRCESGHRRTAKPKRPALKRQVPLPTPSPPAQQSTQPTTAPYIAPVALPVKQFDRKICAMYGCVELCVSGTFNFCSYSHQYHALIQNKINLACEFCRMNRRKEGWNCCSTCHKQKAPAKPLY
ncbi:hypothetical protein FRC03_009015 [Tulasnella sp. 419]|nr:hypothetical protein FRC03_009015 [Tulasnella sp. 419]